MRANVLPWLLVAVIVGAWLGATFLGGEPGAGPVDVIGAEDEGAVRAELTALRLEVRRLEKTVSDLQQSQPATLEGRTSESAAPDGGRAAAPSKSRDAPSASTQAEAGRLVRSERRRRASAQSRLWLDQLRTLESHLVREEALRAIRAGIDSENPVQRLAALRAVRWVGSNDYDHAEYRTAIEPHASSEDPDIRRAAREALAVVQPLTSDLAMWIEEAQRADRSNAETTTEFLVRVAEGRIEDEVADAVLHLLRDGTDIKKAFVIRGLAEATVFDPRVEARLIEIVRSVEPHDYDSGYFFHFLAPRLDPKSDAVVDLILDRVGKGQYDISTPLRGLRKGLSETQRAYAAERLLGFAENAGTTTTRRAILDGLRYIAGPAEVPRLQVLAEDPDADNATRGAARRVIETVERRAR